MDIGSMQARQDQVVRRPSPKCVVHCSPSLKNTFLEIIPTDIICLYKGCLESHASNTLVNLAGDMSDNYWTSCATLPSTGGLKCYRRADIGDFGGWGTIGIERSSKVTPSLPLSPSAQMKSRDITLGRALSTPSRSCRRSSAWQRGSSQAGQIQHSKVGRRGTSAGVVSCFKENDKFQHDESVSFYRNKYREMEAYPMLRYCLHWVTPGHSLLPYHLLEKEVQAKLKQLEIAYTKERTSINELATRRKDSSSVRGKSHRNNDTRSSDQASKMLSWKDSVEQILALPGSSAPNSPTTTLCELINKGPQWSILPKVDDLFPVSVPSPDHLQKLNDSEQPLQTNIKPLPTTYFMPYQRLERRRTMLGSSASPALYRGSYRRLKEREGQFNV